MRPFLLLFLLLLFHNVCLAQSLVVYPSPVSNYGRISNKYLVNITQAGVAKQSFVYESTGGIGPSTEWETEENNNFHFTTFSFSGAITIKVTKLNSSASSAVVRPNELGIGTLNTVTQGTNENVSFRLSKPAKVLVESNDAPTCHDALMIFADILESASNVLHINGANDLFSDSPRG